MSFFSCFYKFKYLGSYNISNFYSKYYIKSSFILYPNLFCLYLL